MKHLIAPTEPAIKSETGIITANATAGSNVTISVANADGLSTNDYVAIGVEGSELCELAKVSGVTNTSFTVGTLKFNHVAGEPFTKYLFNKRKFYGATTATGSYTELVADGSPKDIHVDDPQGTPFEYTDTTYTYFKATYYNSTTATETDLADSEAVLADETLRYASIYAIRKHAGLVGNPFYSDYRLETKRKQAENEIDSAILARYTLPLAEVPPLISQICELLAAGYIDYEEFGSDGQGVKWLGEARALLKNIVNGDRALIGAAKTVLAEQTDPDQLPSGYPNDPDTDEPVFAMSDKF